jgi:hypothetical protein
LPAKTATSPNWPLVRFSNVPKSTLFLTPELKLGLVRALHEILEQRNCLLTDRKMKKRKSKAFTRKATHWQQNKL